MDNKNQEFYVDKQDFTSQNYLLTNLKSQPTDRKLQQNQEQDQLSESRKSKLTIQGATNQDLRREGSDIIRQQNQQLKDDKDSSVRDQDVCSDMSPFENMSDRLGFFVDVQNQKNSSQKTSARQERKYSSNNQLSKQHEQHINRAKQINKSKKKIKSIFYKIKLSMNISFFVQKLLQLIYKKQYNFFQNYPQYQQIITDKSSQYYDSNTHKFKFSESVKQNKQGLFAKQFYQNASYYEIITSKLKVNEKFLLILDKFPVFLPFSINRMIWDTLQLTMLSFYFILIPLQIAFNNFISDVDYTHIVSEIFFIFICLDILVICNTSLFIQGKLIENRLQIFQHYKKKGFKKDIISLIPLLFISIIHQYSIYDSYKRFFDAFLVIFYWRFQNCRSFLKKIEIRLHFSPIISQILKLAKLLFLNLYIIHCLACVWIMIGDQNKSLSWMQILQIQDSFWYIKYLCAFYYNTVTMVTVGYGDITPQTHQERFLSIITVLSACGVFAYSITEVGSIFKEIEFYKKQIKQNIFIINNYMKKKNISHELQYQVRDYLEYFWKESKYQDLEDEKKIINQLSINLKESLMIEANRAFILQSPIFNDNFTLKTILKIIPLIKEQKYNPEEIIYIQDETEDNSIYFIEKGQVEIFQASQNMYSQTQSFVSLKAGSFFGENEFFTGQPRKQSFRSVEFTTLLKIERDKFLSIIQEDNGDYERYCLIRDSILNKYNIKKITRQCQLCQGVPGLNSYHLEQNCPIVHYIPNITKIQGLFSLNQQQSNRQNFKRKQLQHETLKCLFHCGQEQIYFYSKNIKLINEYFANFCYKSNQISDSEQNINADQMNFLNNLQENAAENSQAYSNSNVTYSSDDSSYDSQNSDIKSNNKKSSISAMAKQSQINRIKQKKKTQLPPEGQSIPEENEQEYVNLMKTSAQRSAFSRQSQVKKQEYGLQNKPYKKNSSSSSCSSEQQDSSEEKSLSVSNIITQNEFYTMKDVAQDQNIPSIQHLSLEEKNNNKVQKLQVNQIQKFQTNSMNLVQQKHSVQNLNSVFSQSIAGTNNNYLTYKKLSSDVVSSQEFKKNHTSMQTTDQDCNNNNNDKNKQEIKEQTEKKDEQIIQEFDKQNLVKKRSHSLNNENNINNQIKTVTKQNQNELQKQTPNIQKIKPYQKNNLNYLRRGSCQVQKLNSFKQINLNSQNINDLSQIKIQLSSNSKIQFQNSVLPLQKNNSSNNISPQNQNLLSDIKKIIENQVDQVSQNVKQIKEIVEKKEKEDLRLEESLKLDFRNIEFTSLEDFDRMKIFEIYFIHNNYDKVILNQNEVQKLASKKQDQNQNQEHKKNIQSQIKIQNQFRQSSLLKQRIQQSKVLRNSQLLFANNFNFNNLNKLQNIRNDFCMQNKGVERNKNLDNSTEHQLSKNKLNNLIESQNKLNKTNSPSTQQESLINILGKMINCQSPIEKDENKSILGSNQQAQNESMFSAKVDQIISEQLSLQNQSSPLKQSKQNSLNRSQFYSPQLKTSKQSEKLEQLIDYDS